MLEKIGLVSLLVGGCLSVKSHRRDRVVVVTRVELSGRQVGLPGDFCSHSSQTRFEAILVVTSAFTS